MVALPFAYLAVLYRMLRSMSNHDKDEEHNGTSVGKVVEHNNENKVTTLEDVAGLPQVVERVQDVVDFLKAPQRFQRLGSGTTVPRGILLHGLPGCGKTLLARAVAGSLMTTRSSTEDETVAMIPPPAVIVFLDEIDAIGKRRSNSYSDSGFGGGGGSNDEREQTLNQLLIEMDGFLSSNEEDNMTVVVMCATNRRDELDPALLRAGRLDRHIYVPYPDANGREAILNLYGPHYSIQEQDDVDIDIDDDIDDDIDN
eukprot:scaffold549614_cov51-Attheya_sp.AAC.1